MIDLQIYEDRQTARIAMADDILDRLKIERERARITRTRFSPESVITRIKLQIEMGKYPCTKT